MLLVNVETYPLLPAQTPGSVEGGTIIVSWPVLELILDPALQPPIPEMLPSLCRPGSAAMARQLLVEMW